MPLHIVEVNDSSDKVLLGVNEWDRDNGGIFIPPQGTSFPSTPSTGEIFLRSDERILYRYTGSAWESLSIDSDDIVPGITGIILISGTTKTRYTTITLACAAASSGDVIAVGPGTYVESFTIPAGVRVRAFYGTGVTTIVGAVTMGAGSLLFSTTVAVPVGGTGVHMPATAPGAIASQVVLVGQGSGKGIFIEASACVLDRIQYAQGAIGQVADVDTSGVCTINGILCHTGSADDIVRCDGGAEVRITEVYASDHSGWSGTDGLEIADAHVLFSDSELEGMDYATHFTHDDGVLEARACAVRGNILDVNIDLTVTGATVKASGVRARISKFYASPLWAQAENDVAIFIQDDTPDDVAQRFFGDVQLGLPEKGTPITAGQGGYFTRGMKVYTTDSTADATTDGGNLTEVTAAAISPTTSTFTFQGTAAGHAILFTTILQDTAVDQIRFYSLLMKIANAAVLSGADEHSTFAFEHWDEDAGTAGEWVEHGAFATRAPAPHYRYANEVFMRASNQEEIRMGLNESVPWDAKTIATVTGNWCRIRLKAAVTTLPTFEQLKLGTSFTQIAENGNILHSGNARYESAVTFAGNIWGESGGVGSNSFAVGSGGTPTGWDHEVKNSYLNGDGDAIYTQFTLPPGVSTCCPVRLRFTLTPSITSSDVDFVASFLVRETSGVLEADPAGGSASVARTLANTPLLTSVAAQSQSVTASLVVGKPTMIEFGPFTVADFYTGDLCLVRLELDDDGVSASNVFACTLDVVTVQWSPGE